MRRNQTMKVDGYDIALFPMEYLRITQGRYSNFSHRGYNAYDLAGKDGGIDLMYAPFDLKVEWVDNGKHKTGAVFSNATPIIMANGRKQQPRTVMMMLWHADTIRHLRVGQTVSQGSQFYSEGTAGMAYGNHVHLELSYGTYTGGYPLFKLQTGYYTLKGRELNIEDCFFINDTKVMATIGYRFKSYNGKIDTKPITTKPKGKEYVVLDKSVDRWGMYKLGVEPVSKNIFNDLRPKKFGGLTYEILGRPYPNTVTIQTKQFGKVNIWIGAGTPHKIIKK